LVRSLWASSRRLLDYRAGERLKVGLSPRADIRGARRVFSI
jgi:hypothetical protein